MLSRRLRLQYTKYIGQMARDLKKTPLVEVRWCGLEKEPKKNKFEPTKPATWEVEILLENDNKEHMAWCEEVESLFDELHQGKKKSANWLPIKPDKEEPRKRQVCRMKLKQWIRDGVSSEGPTVFNDKGLMWDSATAIGNGSKMIIGYDVFAWEGPTGAGLSLQPRAAQVKEHMAFEGGGSGVTASDFGFSSSKEADAAVLEAKANTARALGHYPEGAGPEPAMEPTDDLPF